MPERVPATLIEAARRYLASLADKERIASHASSAGAAPTAPAISSAARR